MDIQKGKQYSVSARFSKRGSPAVFVNPPIWSIYNSEDVELLTGAASPSVNEWVATFTISNNYVVPLGKEDLLLQFSGFDNKNAQFIIDKNLTLLDNSEEFKPDGIIYNLISPRAIIDTITLPDPTATLRIRIVDPTGMQVGTTLTMSSTTPVSTNSSGYVYKFTIGDPLILANNFNDPYQIVIDYDGVSGSDTEMHPLYVMDMKIINQVSKLRMFLDKARLIEIDPALQWQSHELVQSVLEGYKYINASPPQVTYWSSGTLPSTMDKYLFNAAALFALNMRFLAEGLQTFDFAGANTQLNYNRTDAISTKMEEMRSELERLPDSKKSAIADSGIGTTTEVLRRIANIGTLGLTTNLLNNRFSPYRRGRFY